MPLLTASCHVAYWLRKVTARLYCTPRHCFATGTIPVLFDVHTEWVLSFFLFFCFVNQHYRNKRSIWILLSSTLLVSYISKEHIDSLLKLKKCSLGNATFGQNAGALLVSLLFLDSAFVLLDINPGQPVWNSVACYWLHTDLSIWNHECDVWKAKNIPCAL